MTLAAAVAGCTTVTVTDARLRPSRYFGVLKLSEVDPSAAAVVAVNGFGLVPGRDGVTLGYRREITITIPSASDCRLVILADQNLEAPLTRLLQSLAKEGGNPCVFTNRGRRLQR
jgi:hypothetical protein